MTGIEEYILEHTTIIVDEQISLGNLNFRLLSNTLEFKGKEFFSKEIRTPYTNSSYKNHFELWCISFNNTTINKKYIINNIDSSYRSNSFAAGYYATDHFGHPVYLITNSSKFFVFGEHLEKVVWCYFVKYFLLLFTINHNSLFLKAAAFNINNKGTLLFGRGNAGKTTFLGTFCQNGASFITNSHAIVKDFNIVGMSTCLRIRPKNIWWKKEINANFKPNLNPGEVIADPNQMFLNHDTKPVKLKNILIIDFLKPKYHYVKKICPQDAYNYIEQFGLGINVYRLEEDLLDYYKGNYKEFVTKYQNMKYLLKIIIQDSNCYYIRSDILDDYNRNQIFKLLS
jgi:hypothetical protein